MSPADKRKSVQEARHARDQFTVVMDTTNEAKEARSVDDAAKQHLVKLLVDEGMYHCFTVNMRAVSRTFR